MNDKSGPTELIPRTWAETLAALKNEYTLSIRDVCRLLKTSRSWVNRYIRPHVDTIYLNSGKRGDYSIGRNWVKMAAVALEREDMTESTWFSKLQLYGLLERSVVSVTKQTKCVPLAYLMDQSTREQYISERDAIRELMGKETDERKLANLAKELEDLPEKFIDKPGLVMTNHRCGITERGKVERVVVPYPGKFDPTAWTAAHDMKDYGDTDEDIYRRLFRTGAIRIELCVPDKDGVVGKKVYYIQDPEFIENEWNDWHVIVPEPVWQAYKAKKGI